MQQPVPVLEARNIDIWRGERCLIRGLSFSVGGGQLALVVGPNGAGKTSLLRVLAGLAPYGSGQVLWNGTAVPRLAPEERADFVYRGHLDGLKKELTVEENLSFSAALRGQAAVFDSLLMTLNLHDVADRQTRFLSAGQRRRVGLAALKLANARLWLLDEPMTNLDAAGRALVTGWVDEHLRGGGIAVVATHQPEELARPGTTLVEL